MTILTPATDYPAIRGALDMTLDENGLPDSLIASSIYEGAAEAEVLRRDPLAAGRTGAELVLIKAAIILLTAALLAPIIPPIEGANTNQAVYGRRDKEVASQVASLRARADEAINAVLYPSTAVLPTIFTVGEGTRGR